VWAVKLPKSPPDPRFGVNPLDLTCPPELWTEAKEARRIASDEPEPIEE
jgi:hypothetical protein